MNIFHMNICLKEGKNRKKWIIIAEMNFQFKLPGDNKTRKRKEFLKSRMSFEQYLLPILNVANSNKEYL